MNPIQKQQQKELEKIEICIDILKNARNELYLSMRFFDVILSGFEFQPNQIVWIKTFDGRRGTGTEIIL